MIIDTSSVLMSASYRYSKTTKVTEASVNTLKGIAKASDVSDDSKEASASSTASKEEESLLSSENAKKLLYTPSFKTNRVEESPVKSKEELQYETLKMILAMLHGHRDGKILPKDLGKMMDLDIELDKSVNILDLTTAAYQGSLAPTPTIWTRTTVSSIFEEETENTAFTSTGIVKTADGRELSFGVSFEMSRSFSSKYSSFSQVDYIVCDPLVIHLSNTTANVTDSKFLFDLDCDGKQDSISFAGEGSGFLALDKNNDGKINDGSELFGTKSGDGFADLSAYDKDANGWIDEADDIFKDLKVWTKDANGNDHLVNLKDVGIGAIYLGHTDTQFSLNNSENQTNGMIRKTGLYLHESGEAGTIQHLDLTV